MKNLNQDTRLTFINRIPVMMIGLMSMIILTRWLGPEGNGIYTFIFANVNLLLLLLGLQTETAVLHYMSKPEEDMQDQGSLGIWAIPVTTAVTAILLWTAGYLIPSFQTILVPHDQPYVYFLWFTILSFLFRKSWNTSLAMLRAMLRFRTYNRMQWIGQVIPAALYVVGFFFLANTKAASDLVTVFHWILAGQAIIAVWGLALVMPHVRMKKSIKPHLKPFLVYAGKSTLDGLAKFINRRLDIYFVQAFRGAGALGQYGLASQITNFTQEIIHPFTQVMNPYLVKADHAGRTDIMARMTRIIFPITLILCAGIIILSPFIIPVLFGQPFIPSVGATQILAIAVVISTLRVIFASYFQSVNQLHVNIRSNGLGVIITIILDILLIPAYGIEGAAWASIIAYAASMAYLFRRLQKETRLAWRDMLFLKKEDIRWLTRRSPAP